MDAPGTADAHASCRRWIGELTGLEGEPLDRYIAVRADYAARVEQAEFASRQPTDLSRNALRAAGQHGRLTPSQVRALDLAADGHTTRDIAATMNVAEATVNANLAVARRVLGAANTAHAVRLAIRQRIIE